MAKIDINSKNRKLLNQDMVTDSWLCIDCCFQLPRELRASSISITKEGFTVDQVEGISHRIYGDNSKNEDVWINRGELQSTICG